MSDRYLRIILTVIALELGWIAVKDTASVEVSAQAQQREREPMPVVIRGVDVQCIGADAGNCRENVLPVLISRNTAPVRITADAALPVDARGLVRIRAEQPIVVETRERPLLIQSVPAGTAPRPGPGE